MLLKEKPGNLNLHGIINAQALIGQYRVSNLKLVLKYIVFEKTL